MCPPTSVRENRERELGRGPGGGQAQGIGGSEAWAVCGYRDQDPGFWGHGAGKSEVRATEPLPGLLSYFLQTFLGTHHFPI